MKLKVLLVLVSLAIFSIAQSEIKNYVKGDDALNMVLINLDKTAKDEDILDDTVSKIQKLYDEEKTLHRQAYLGSLISRKATFTIFPWSKLGYAKEGSKMLDKAIKKNNDDLDLRIVRMNTYINFPDLLNKELLVLQDYKIVFAKFNEKNENDSFSSTFEKNTLLSLIARYHARYGDKSIINKYFDEISSQDRKEEVEEFKKEYL